MKSINKKCIKFKNLSFSPDVEMFQIDLRNIRTRLVLLSLEMTLVSRSLCKSSSAFTEERIQPRMHVEVIS